MSGDKRLRIGGHVEAEALWKLKETVTVKSVQKKGSLVSPSLSESFRSEGSTKEVTQQARAGEEAFSEVNIGKQSNHGFVGAVMGKGSSISDRELMGEEPEIVADDTVKSKNRNKMLEGDMKNEKKNVNWAELLFKDELARVETGVRLGSSRNIVREASFSNQVLGGPNGAKEGFVDKLGTNPSQRVNLEASTAPLSGQREKQVCGVENNSPSPIDKSLDIELEVVEDRSSDSEKEEGLYKAERIFFPEIDSKRVSKKRYGSLMHIQGKSISEKERKKRDRAVCKEKLRSKGWDMSELSGRSLSDSDLVYRWEVLTKKALALGKRLGAEIEGNEEGAMRELAFLESRY
ncbi:hypothetical protein V6N12_058471 [Hibiscus sabdariffa]|uniref:Uncharacterized protein n=1 Tax=Hibiscus sabdariffa TaxID=183260 RepID=A0ABR2ESN9_9ROSI